MKSTGIVRKVDELGRIVIPIELRRGLGVEVKDPIEIFIDGDRIILKKSTALIWLVPSQEKYHLATRFMEMGKLF